MPARTANGQRRSMSLYHHHHYYHTAATTPPLLPISRSEGKDGEKRDRDRDYDRYRF